MIKIRLGYSRYGYVKRSVIKVCPHITIYAEKRRTDGGCEYIEKLELNCLACRKKFAYYVLVN